MTTAVFKGVRVEVQATGYHDTETDTPIYIAHTDEGEEYVVGDSLSDFREV